MSIGQLFYLCQRSSREDRDSKTGLQELNFNPEVTWKAQLAGREDAKASLADDKSVNVKDFFVECVYGKQTISGGRNLNVKKKTSRKVTNRHPTGGVGANVVAAS